jgi:hypothetical protein
MIAAINARKSHDQNVTDEQKSVACQIEHGRAYAVRHGWTVGRFFWTSLRHLGPRWCLRCQRRLTLTTSLEWHSPSECNQNGSVSEVPAAGRFDSGCPSNVHSRKTSASAANHHDPRPICCGSGSGYTHHTIAARDASLF